MEFMKNVEEVGKKVGETVSNTYNTVVSKSGKFIDDTKLKIAISDKEADIDETYEEIGKAVYSRYQSGEETDKDILKLAKKIDKLKTEIKDMQTKILYNKSLRECSNCGEVISIDSKFCTNCGEKQKAVKIKEEKKEAKKEEVEVEKVCPECGEICDKEVKFCSKCGHQF